MSSANDAADIPPFITTRSAEMNENDPVETNQKQSTVLDELIKQVCMTADENSSTDTYLECTTEGSHSTSSHASTAETSPKIRKQRKGNQPEETKDSTGGTGKCLNDMDTNRSDESCSVNDHDKEQNRYGGNDIHELEQVVTLNTLSFPSESSSSSSSESTLYEEDELSSTSSHDSTRLLLIQAQHRLHRQSIYEEVKLLRAQLSTYRQNAENYTHQKVLLMNQKQELEQSLMQAEQVIQNLKQEKLWMKEQQALREKEYMNQLSGYCREFDEKEQRYMGEIMQRDARILTLRNELNEMEGKWRGLRREMEIMEIEGKSSRCLEDVERGLEEEKTRKEELRRQKYGGDVSASGDDDSSTEYNI
mmetsp:Transcript_10226/g.18817  ORF Transcript_10226/g.18817 Transcript_10226/m.18817 type:complete len:363 (+) Transcript_10226:102-1190(+)